MSKQPIYVVTAGQYSDYHIRGVFSTEEKAEAFCRQFNQQDFHTDARVERYCLDAPEMDEEGVQLYAVRVDADGKITEMHTEGSEYREFGGAYVWGLPGEEQAVASSSRGFDVAAKIARDELAAFKATETERGDV